MKESAKDMASRGMESAKETGQKAADKGHGLYLDVYVMLHELNVLLCRLEMKESAKDVASRGIESAKETGQKASEKGHGKKKSKLELRAKSSNVNNTFFMSVELKESAKDTAKQGKESVQETGSKIAEKGRGNIQVHQSCHAFLLAKVNRN